ncbi:hypothetical protein [Duncaniella dubosii]
MWEYIRIRDVPINQTMAFNGGCQPNNHLDSLSSRKYLTQTVSTSSGI